MRPTLGLLVALLATAGVLTGGSARQSHATRALIEYQFDEPADARWWMGYDYEVIDSRRFDGFTPVSVERAGGAGGGGYIWLDDSRWGIDVPDGNNILAISMRRSLPNFPPDLRGATVEFWVRGQGLDLHGGYANLYIYHADTGTTTHMSGRPFAMPNGEWTQVRVTLDVDEAIWHRSWWRQATGGNPAPADLTYGGSSGEGFAPIDLALREVDAIGIAFRGFTSEVTGRFDLDGFRVTRTVRVCTPRAGADCEGAFLSAGTFAREDWRRGNFKSADLSAADLRGADLRGANLAGATLFRARLEDARLDGADLRGARLDKAVLRGAALTGARLDGAFLQKVEAEFADFSDASLASARAQGSLFYNSRFERADLTRADFTGADLRSTAMAGVKGEGAILTDARVSRTVLTGANLPGLRAVRADLSFADFTRADISGAVMQHANLFRALFQRARVAGVDFEKADLLHATWIDGTQCPAADASRCGR